MRGKSEGNDLLGIECDYGWNEISKSIRDEITFLGRYPAFKSPGDMPFARPRQWRKLSPQPQFNHLGRAEDSYWELCCAESSVDEEKRLAEAVDASGHAVGESVVREHRVFVRQADLSAMRMADQHGICSCASYETNLIGIMSQDDSRNAWRTLRERFDKRWIEVSTFDPRKPRQFDRAVADWDGEISILNLSDAKSRQAR